MKFDIVTYHDVKDKFQFAPLMSQAFEWTPPPGTFETRARDDFRLKGTPVAFCALVNRRLASMVGVMHIPTRTRKGDTMMTGGLWGVATLPEFAGQGLARKLLDTAHAQFRRERFPFSMLFTRETLIAYKWYLRDGYCDVLRFKSAHKQVSPRNAATPIASARTDAFDWNKARRIFAEYAHNKTGYVVRPKAYETMVKIRKRADEARSVLMPGGYALLAETEGRLYIQELIALDDHHAHRLVAAAEVRAKDMLIGHGIVDESVYRTLLSHGYLGAPSSYGVFMAKPLTARADFHKTYGDSFFLSPLDDY
ncbi:MAG: GNAT family N-acetyltransferase [bacterium]